VAVGTVVPLEVFTLIHCPGPTRTGNGVLIVPAVVKSATVDTAGAAVPPPSAETWIVVRLAPPVR